MSFPKFLHDNFSTFYATRVSLTSPFLGNPVTNLCRFLGCLYFICSSSIFFALSFFDLSEPEMKGGITLIVCENASDFVIFFLCSVLLYNLFPFYMYIG